MKPSLLEYASLVFALLPSVTLAVDPYIDIKIGVPAPDSRLRTIDRNLISWSIQNRDFPVFAKTKHLRNYFNALSTNTATGQSIRLGGGESDKSSYDPEGTLSKQRYLSNYYGAQAAGNVTLGPNYFATFKNIYSKDTKYIWCLNLINETNNFEAAISTATGVIENLGDELELFEIGNEADFYGSKGFRPASWDATQMLPQWNYIADKIEKDHPNTTVRFSAGGFANPVNSVTKDFDIPGIVAAGFKGSRIPWYTMHLYPQSGCRQQVTLQSLLYHDALVRNITGYIPQVQAAESVGGQFAIGESNTVSCTGRSGVSDTFAAALWLVDYALGSASIGIRRIYLHATDKASYSPIIPVTYSLLSGNYSAGVLPLAYGGYFLSEVLSSQDSLLVSPIAGGNDTDYSSYAIWDEKNNLKKIVAINLELYNSTIGTESPATESSPVFASNYDRPSTIVNISTPWNVGVELSVIKLQGPGSNAKSQVNVSDFTFSQKDGSIEHNLVDTIIKVGPSGYVTFNLRASEAALVQSYQDVISNPHPSKPGSHSSNSTSTSSGDATTRTRGASSSDSSIVRSYGSLLYLACFSAIWLIL